MIKKIAQFLASIVYTPIYSGVMYLLITLSFMFIVSLPTKWMVLVLIFFGTILTACISLLQVFGMLPYGWILNGNKPALIASILLFSLLQVCNIYSLWSALLGHGFIGIVFGIILTIMLISFVFTSIVGMIKCYNRD